MLWAATARYNLRLAGAIDDLPDYGFTDNEEPIAA